MHADIIRITDAGEDCADPSQRYGWTLDRDGEPLFRSTEQYDDEDYTRQMARQAVLDAEYRHAMFEGEDTPIGKAAQTELALRKLVAIVGVQHDFTIVDSPYDEDEIRAAYETATALLA